MHIALLGDDWKVKEESAGHWLAMRKKNPQVLKIPLAAVETALVSTVAHLHADFLFALWRHGAQVTVLEPNGKLLATSSSATPLAKATLWRRQLTFVSTQEALVLAQAWVYQKQKRQAELMASLQHEYAGELQRLASTLKQELDAGGKWMSASAAEGRAAKLYWSGFGSLLPKAYDWNGREQQGPSNIVNAALNYGYGVLYGTVRNQVLKRGLHPGLGVIHSEARGGDALLYDLGEPLRPVVEHAVLSIIRKRQLALKNFDAEKGYLRGDSKTKLVEAVFEGLHREWLTYGSTEEKDPSTETVWSLWSNELSMFQRGVRASKRQTYFLE